VRVTLAIGALEFDLGRVMLAIGALRLDLRLISLAIRRVTSGSPPDRVRIASDHVPIAP
jgi:hypothetical protein